MDWKQARLLYVSDPTATYESVAEAVGAAFATIANRGKAEEWRARREEYQEEILSASLAAGLEDRVKGGAALIRMQYGEALAHARQLIAKREEHGGDWTPRDHLAHATAMERVFGIARQALGLPSDFKPEPTRQELAPVVVAWLPDRATDGNG